MVNTVQYESITGERRRGWVSVPMVRLLTRKRYVWTAALTFSVMIVVVMITKIPNVNSAFQVSTSCKPLYA